MAELSTEATACCTQRQQETCCEPSAKAACCGAAPDKCGCPQDIREAVRERYAAAARVAASTGGCGCDPGLGLADETGRQVFGDALYAEADTESADVAVAASLGCGVPTAVADLSGGETVLDLGSGAGADVLISARRVGPAGRAIGIDMTDEMLDLARRNAVEAGIANAGSARATSRTCRSPMARSTPSSPTASSTSPATSPRFSPKPPVSSSQAGGSRSPT